MALHDTSRDHSQHYPQRWELLTGQRKKKGDHTENAASINHVEFTRAKALSLIRRFQEIVCRNKTKLGVLSKERMFSSNVHHDIGEQHGDDGVQLEGKSAKSLLHCSADAKRYKRSYPVFTASDSVSTNDTSTMAERSLENGVHSSALDQTVEGVDKFTPNASSSPSRLYPSITSYTLDDRLYPDAIDNYRKFPDFGLRKRRYDIEQDVPYIRISVPNSSLECASRNDIHRRNLKLRMQQLQQMRHPLDSNIYHIGQNLNLYNPLPCKLFRPMAGRGLNIHTATRECADSSRTGAWK